MIREIIVVFALVGGFCSEAMSGEFDFDWNDRNDMRGAWEMCETTGFTGGDCPKVYTKCWQHPMIYKKKKKYRTYCKDDSKFSVNQNDVDRYLQEANKRANGGGGNAN